MVIIQGGLTKDPEVYEDKVVHLSVAVDNSGNEKGVKNAPGYFDVKIWMTPSKMTPEVTTEALKTAINEKTLKKGAKISVIGRLIHERWKDDTGKRSSRAVIMAESFNILYSGSRATTPKDEDSSTVSNEAVTYIDEF
jgi:hypothetical protein